MLIILENDDSLVNKKPTIIMFHGNAGNIGNRLDLIRNYIFSADVNVMIGKLNIILTLFYNYLNYL